MPDTEEYHLYCWKDKHLKPPKIKKIALKVGLQINKMKRNLTG